jgi:hypothetical protein
LDRQLPPQQHLILVHNQLLLFHLEIWHPM